MEHLEATKQLHVWLTEIVKEYMANNFLSEKLMGYAIGISGSSIHNLLHGKLLSFSTLEQIFNFFDLKIELFHTYKITDQMGICISESDEEILKGESSI